jgi:hypothetical protein
MSSEKSFAKKYGLKIMLVGFAVLAVGAMGNVTQGAPWSMPVIGTGLAIYAVGRVLQMKARREQ